MARKPTADSIVELIRAAAQPTPTAETRSVSELWAECKARRGKPGFEEWCRQHWRLGLYDPSAVPERLEFHRSRARKRVVQAPNQVGKTWMACAEDWCHALGWSPWSGQLHDGPTTGLIAIASEANRRPVHRALYETCPHAAIDWESTTFDAGRQEWVGDRIRLRNGSLIFLVSTSQKRMSLAGETVHWLHIDEPPREHTFGELLMRSVRHAAPVWLSFTPIADEDLTWLERLLYGDPDRGIPPGQPDWVITRLQLSAACCPWLSTEALENFIATCPPGERAQRIEGEFRGYAVERVFSSFQDSYILREIPCLEGYEFAVGIDHGEVAGHQVAILLAYKPVQPILLLDEWCSDRRTNTTENAAAIRVMLERNTITPAHVGLWVGDTNTAGQVVPGKSINDLLCAELGLKPGKIGAPDKSGGAVALGNTRVNDAMGQGRFHVMRRCSGSIAMFRQWKGKEDKHKHYRDGFVYPAVKVMNILRIGVTSAPYRSRIVPARRELF